jgi:hypothetical protein
MNDQVASSQELFYRLDGVPTAAEPHAAALVPNGDAITHLHGIHV